VLIQLAIVLVKATKTVRDVDVIEILRTISPQFSYLQNDVAIASVKFTIEF
jgi:hypothetical protein